MNTFKQGSLFAQCPSVRKLIAFALITVFTVIAGQVLAGPGAHGPNGEHLDAPVMRASGGPPRFAVSSEIFELVGELERGVLTLHLDRYATNQPVTGAKIELESGAIRATAQYQADREVYQVSSPEFIEAISKSGEHSLVITVLAGRDTDLLDATLQIANSGARSASAGGRFAADHDHLGEWMLGAGVILLVVAAGLYGWRQYQRKPLRTSVGVSS
jgi:hypothetical protein